MSCLRCLVRDFNPKEYAHRMQMSGGRSEYAGPATAASRWHISNHGGGKSPSRYSVVAATATATGTSRGGEGHVDMVASGIALASLV